MVQPHRLQTVTKIHKIIKKQKFIATLLTPAHLSMLFISKKFAK